MTTEQCPAGRVFQYRVGSGRVLDKIPGSGSGRCVEIYDWVFLGIFFYSQVYPGIPGCFRVFLGISGYFWVSRISSLFLEVVSQK